MNLDFSSDLKLFSCEVEEWIEDIIPSHIRKKVDVGSNFEYDDIMEWHKLLYQKGWIAPLWPKKYGGTGWDIAKCYIFQNVLDSKGTPVLSPFGLIMLGPLLIQFGTDEQKKRFLPKILSGEETWCQGYSEPNAGSDLASLQLSAEEDGDYYVLNGQKTWTTYGQYADFIFCLVRTDNSVRKQEGISFILVDIKNTEGVEVRPFLNISGLTSFCDTFFTNARVPKSNLVGKKNEGWSIAKALLGHERIAVGSVGSSKRMLNTIKKISKNTYVGDKRLLDDITFREKIVALEIKCRALEISNLRTLSAIHHGHSLGSESSILKLYGSQVEQATYELALEAMGHNAMGWFDNNDAVLPPQEKWIASKFNYSRATTIYAGSNEIQRNIIAQRILGLPKK